MKKTLVLLLLLGFAGMALAIAPVNHTAKLLPEKGMLISGGTSNSFTTVSAEFTYAFAKANLHGKAYYVARSVHLEGLMQHYLTDLKTIDMGFSYGSHILFGPSRLEIAAIAMWNMSYTLASNVAFYGGLKYTIGYGNFFSGYFINRLNTYLGTEIDLVKNLKLYVEIQTNIFGAANNAFMGVNYYFPNKSAAPVTPGA